MKVLRYLNEVKLLKAIKVKQSNGTYINTYTTLGTYKIVKSNIQNQVNATIYGSDVIKMYNISTPLGDLEKLLLNKMNNSNDNISLYYIEFDSVKYKIKSVTENDITIERL